MNDLLIRLSHELAAALEMNHTPAEMASPTWSEAIDALGETRNLLRKQGVAVPDVVDNVLLAVVA